MRLCVSGPGPPFAISSSPSSQRGCRTWSVPNPVAVPQRNANVLPTRAQPGWTHGEVGPPWKSCYCELWGLSQEGRCTGAPMSACLCSYFHWWTKIKDVVKAKERFGWQKEEVSPLSYSLFLLYDSSFNRMTRVHMSIFILSRCLFPACWRLQWFTRFDVQKFAAVVSKGWFFL